MEVTTTKELDDQAPPGLLDDDNLINCTVDTLDNVIKDEKIRTKV